MKINIFTPPGFEFSSLNIHNVECLIGKKLHYASRGRHALFHILSSLKITGPLLLPAFICDSIMLPIKKMHIDIIYYDIDLTDLNASIESIIYLAEKYACQAVLVSSMYGNPANLVEIESYCKNKKILLIDDAAQSFGSKLEHRYVGTFGNAGFFSFSPGKPTAGHMGAFFWTEKNFEIERKKNYIFHYLAYLDYYFNRLKLKKYGKFKIFIILNYFRRVLERFIDISNDEISSFERKILGGILNFTLFEKFHFRKKYYAEFLVKFDGNSCFRVLQASRGHPQPHKIVLICKTSNVTNLLLKYLQLNLIYACKGYLPLTSRFDNLPNLLSLKDRIVEIPIEDDEQSMIYLLRVIESFLSCMINVKESLSNEA